VSRSGGLRRRSGLRRTGFLRRSRLRRSPSATRRAISEASAPQRAKVAGARCLVCGRVPCDPAHLVPRSLGGCDEPDCVVPLCRSCHREFDEHRLCLLPYLEPRYRGELAHGLLHLGVVMLVERVTSERWPSSGSTER
jgi:5-methylcytosine-specific restriction endonuclease McrA